jgi:hypothetical protein
MKNTLIPLSLKSLPILCGGFLFLHSMAIVPRSIAQGIPITLDNLQNTTYNIPNYGQVTVSNGQFQGSAGKMTSVTVSDDALLGNFDRDPSPDGVAVLKVTFDPSTGLRSKYYLALVTNSNGTPSNVNTVFLGEGVNIDRVSTQNGTVTVTMPRYNPGDPSCCPSGIIIKQYAIDPGTPRLILTRTEEQQPNGVTVRDVPAPTLGLDSNLPYQPPVDEIQVSF